MKTATAPLIALLNAAGGANPFYEFDFYTFVLTDGTMLRYGTAQFTIGADDATIWNPDALDGSGGLWFNGITWAPSDMGARGDFGTIGHWGLGLDADTFSLVYVPEPVDPITGATFPDKINGVPWLKAARAGALYDADCIVSTAYFDAMPTGPIPPGGVSPVGTLVTTRGIVGTVDVSDNGAIIGVADYRQMASRNMPRTLYQAGCRHRLFDSRCTLVAATFTETGTLAGGSSGTALISTLPLPAPGGSDTYELGVLTMTSGDNDGFKRLVVRWDGASVLTLLSPFPYAVAEGDTFSVSAGCDKTLATCTAFGNEDNFGGEPFIPLPEVQIG